MSKRVLAVLSLALSFGLSLAACQEKTSPSVAYTSPGWYLERPRAVLARGPEIFAGPFNYDQCEIERLKFDPPTAQRLICNRVLTKPGTFGPY
jgi:hypothetical protein